jgi:hypothetical protein
LFSLQNKKQNNNVMQIIDYCKYLCLDSFINFFNGNLEIQEIGVKSHGISGEKI